MAEQASDVRLARRGTRPVRAIGLRLGLAAAAVLAVVALVVLGRGGYRDVNGDGISVLDAVYYATVSLSTTGYGDIVPVSPGARLVNIVLVTPLRVAFLIVLVGTTLEVLTARSRDLVRQRRWRSRLNGHVVVCGYGTTGRSAVRTLLAQGTSPDRVVVVDTDADLVAEANRSGLNGVVGNVTRAAVLQAAEVARAGTVVVAVHRDDTAALTVLTVREVSETTRIVASVREQENYELLRRAGADTVVTSADAAGRLLALSTVSRHVVDVVSDLMSAGQGLDLSERAVQAGEVGRTPRELAGLVLGVVRDGRLIQGPTGRDVRLAAGDRVVCVTTEADPPAGVDPLDEPHRRPASS